MSHVLHNFVFLKMDEIETRFGGFEYPKQNYQWNQKKFIDIKYIAPQQKKKMGRNAIVLKHLHLQDRETKNFRFGTRLGSLRYGHPRWWFLSEKRFVIDTSKT